MRIEQSPRLLGAGHGKGFRVQQANLDKEARLVPIDVLVGDAPVIIEAHHDDVRQNDPSAGRLNARPRDLCLG